MTSVFDLLGVLLGLYTVYAATAGSVYVKQGPGGRSLLRNEQPGYFWTVVAIYGTLSVALISYF